MGCNTSRAVPPPPAPPPLDRKPKPTHKVVFTKGLSLEHHLHPEKKVHKTFDEATSIARVLDSCYVFAATSDDQREELAEYMFKEQIDVGHTVCVQGEPGDKFYAIQCGTFDFFVDGQFVTRRSGNSKDAYFGELALMYNSPRQATAMCVSVTDDAPPAASTLHSTRKGFFASSAKAVLWAIDRDTFREVLAVTNQKSREERRLAVQAIPMLREALSEDQLNRVIESVKLLHFPAGQRIVKKGDKGDVCYFIRQGTVLCSKIGDAALGTIELGPGTYFGERALVRDEPRAADVTAVTDVVAMALDRKSFDELLGPLRSVMDDHMKERVVQALPILRELNSRLRQEVIADFELETFREGDVIVTAGEKKCDKFYVVRVGSVRVLDPPEKSTDDALSGHEIAFLKEGEWFGEMALLNDEPRVATCVAAAPRVECFVLRRATFQAFCNQSKTLAAMNEHRRRVNTRRRGSGDLSATEVANGLPPAAMSSSATFVSNNGEATHETFVGGGNSSATSLPDTPEEICGFPTAYISGLKLTDLDKLRVLGKGTFGTVFLVAIPPMPPKTESLPKTNSPSVPTLKRPLFALKAMNKHNLVRCEQKANVMNEKQMLSEADEHPFVLQLVRTYQDPDTLYMLLEFVQGGELFSVMQEKYRFPTYPTFFYAACIVDVFDYIHSLNIVFRDLKPENVLLDKYGYVKLADFGFAKKITDKTYTLCGTPEYLAPEVVLGKGHDKGVDYWGIGILIYEMLVGMSPFADEYDEDQHVVCNNIVKGHVAYDKLNRAILDTESKPDTFWKLPSHFLPLGSVPAHGNSSRRLGAIAGSSGALPVEDLIRKLLTKNPVQRLGNLKDGARDVKRHIFFCEIHEWEDLRQRKLQAPFVPALKGDDDTSRFDAFEQDAVWPKYKGTQDWAAGF